MSIRFRGRRPRTLTVAASATAVVLLSSSSSSSPPWPSCHGFTAAPPHRRSGAARARPLGVFAPPGSGYVSDTYAAEAEEDDDDDAGPSATAPGLTTGELRQVSPHAFPSTYEPMLEYPGTMRPGRTPENAPYHDLPNLGIDDPDPIPWPHLQEIEWHHRWDPPHPQAMTVEDMIESEGRWASVEDEAEMRMGLRRGVRERREAEETGGAGVGPLVITDDEDEDDEEGAPGAGGAPGTTADNLGLELGDGVEALLRTVADATSVVEGVEEEALAEEEEGDDDDFLLDLGLGGAGAEGGDDATPAVDAKAATEDEDDDDDDDDLDLAFELGFDLDDEDDDAEEEEEEDTGADAAVAGAFEILDGSDDGDMSLDDYNKEDDQGDDDALDDGGFDYGE